MRWSPIFACCRLSPPRQLCLLDVFRCHSQRLELGPPRPPWLGRALSGRVTEPFSAHFPSSTRAAGFPSLSNRKAGGKHKVAAGHSFFTSSPFLLFNRAAGFLPPQLQLAEAGARRVCQGWPLFCGHRRLGLDTPEHGGTLVQLGPSGLCSPSRSPFTSHYRLRRVHRSLRGRGELAASWSPRVSAPK